MYRETSLCLSCNWQNADLCAFIASWPKILRGRCTQVSHLLVRHAAQGRLEAKERTGLSETD